VEASLLPSYQVAAHTSQKFEELLFCGVSTAYGLTRLPSGMLDGAYCIARLEPPSVNQPRSEDLSCSTVAAPTMNDSWEIAAVALV